MTRQCWLPGDDSHGAIVEVIVPCPGVTAMNFAPVSERAGLNSQT
jgi:hypothetical protein